MDKGKIGSFGLALLGAVITMGLGACEGEPANTGEAPVDFVTEIKPMLQAQCVRCHHDGAIMGGLNLMNREHAMKGSSKGPVIVPGEPEKSSLYQVTLLSEEENHAMPATGPKLTAAEKELLRRWIAEGAPWPEGEEGVIRPIEAKGGV